VTEVSLAAVALTVTGVTVEGSAAGSLP